MGTRSATCTRGRHREDSRLVLCFAAQDRIVLGAEELQPWA